MTSDECCRMSDNEAETAIHILGECEALASWFQQTKTQFPLPPEMMKKPISQISRLIYI